MIKNIEGHKLKNSTKHATSVKSINGATTQGMAYHVKGCIKDFHPDILILNAGTNDLKSTKPDVIAENLIKMAIEASKEGIKVMISTLINRGDDLNSKANEVNDFLYNIALENDIHIIDNGNINLEMLNRGKLHLNRYGSIQLAKNFRNAILN